MDYDRMSPDFSELLARLEEYSKIDHGIDAYPLSKKEAHLIVEIFNKSEEIAKLLKFIVDQREAMGVPRIFVEND